MKAPEPSAKPNDKAPIVLVAEDDAAIRTMLVRALGPTYIVYEARDGEEAMVVLKSIPRPHALILDVMMPKVDGFSVAKAVRTEPTLRGIPIIFLTAKGQAQDVISGINAGARHYITKPFNIAEVLQKVASMIRTKT